MILGTALNGAAEFMELLLNAFILFTVIAIVIIVVVIIAITKSANSKNRKVIIENEELQRKGIIENGERQILPNSTLILVLGILSIVTTCCLSIGLIFIGFRCLHK